MKKSPLVFSLTLALFAGCAAQQPETITTEHHGKIVVVHHRRRVGHGSIDKIEAIDAKGSVTTAEVHVYDVGRYVDQSGDIHEAHRVYRDVQSQRPNLMLPKKVSAGPRTVFSPPNYSPMPADQRINDAVTEAQQSKAKLDQASKDLQKRLAEDNNLKGELQDQISENQKLQDQLNASMSTGHSQKTAPTDAEKAAQASASDLQKWGQSQSQGQ